MRNFSAVLVQISAMMALSIRLTDFVQYFHPAQFLRVHMLCDDIFGRYDTTAYQKFATIASATTHII